MDTTRNMAQMPHQPNIVQQHDYHVVNEKPIAHDVPMMTLYP